MNLLKEVLNYKYLNDILFIIINDKKFIFD